MDSSPSTMKHMQPAKVDQKVFLGVAWGGVVIAAAFFASRIYIRIITFRKLFMDDLLALLAWLMFFVSTILWQLYAKYLYQNLAVSSGQLFPPPPSFENDTITYLKATVAVIIFFYSSLWMVKFSFLVLFRRLGSKVKGQTIHWWIVTAITVASWIATFGTLEYPCLVPPDLAHLEATCIGSYAIHFQRRTLLANMLMDVFTDILIITIPTHLLWNVKISLRQKLALMGLFSLTVIIMVFAIVRVAVISSYSNMPDESWLYLWSSIEQTVSIMVAWLASFRILFVRQDTSGHRAAQAYSAGSSSRRGLLGTKGLKSFFSTKERLPDHEPSKEDAFGTKRTHTTYTRGARPSESGEHIIPLDSIHVQRKFEATSHPRAVEAEVI